jgi:DNA-directed RNA polymerase specialized sigma24 family protein
MLRRAQGGDRRAQEVFLQRYVRPLHSFVRRSGAPGDPDDLTQELLSKLLHVLPRFSLDGSATRVPSLCALRQST